MISSWKAAVALLLLAGVLSIAWTINHYRKKAITYKDQRDMATVRVNSSEATTNNVITTMNLIHDIS